MDNSNDSYDIESVPLSDLSNETTSEPTSEWMPGKLVAGSYSVVKKLARGGMAEVYLLSETSSGKLIAAKRPIGPFLKTRSLRDMFIREARSWAALPAHPNIVRAINVGEIDYLPCILMEYVDGNTLAGALSSTSNGLPITDALRLALHICWAMGHAHEQGLVHRDLKPSNAMLTSDGSAKVTDFGLAANRTNPASLTNDNDAVISTIGTWEYMAPEQWDGAVWPSIDIYSFGVLLFQMLTGRHPLAHAIQALDSQTSIQSKAYSYRDMHRNAIPGDPASFNPGIPSAVRDITLACLSKTISGRPGSFAEIADIICAEYDRCASGSERLVKPNPTALDRRQRNRFAWNLLILGNGACNRGDMDAALEQYMEAEAIFHELNNHNGLCMCYNLIGNIYNDIGRQDRALMFYSMSLEMPRTPKISDSKAGAWLGVGNIQTSQGDYENASIAYQKAYEIWERLGNKRGLAKCLLNQGFLLSSTGDLDEAQAKYEESMSMFSDLGDEYEVANSKTSIAEIANKKGDYPGALEILLESLPVLERYGGRHGAALCCLSIGETLFKSGNASEALSWYQKSAEALETLGCKDHLADCLILLGQACEHLQQNTEADTAYSKACAIKQELGRSIPESMINRHHRE